MSELNKPKIAMVGMCFREHGRPYYNRCENCSKLRNAYLEKCRILSEENEILKKENNEYIVQLIELKMKIANLMSQRFYVGNEIEHG